MSKPLNKVPWREFTDADRERMKRDDELRFMNGYVVNPSPKVLSTMVRKSAYEELRGLHVDGNLYWWDAIIATHGHAYRYLGLLDRARADLGNRDLWDIELHVDRKDNASVFMTAASDKGLALAMAHPSLVGAFTEEGDLIDT